MNPAGSKEKIGEKMKEAQQNYGKDGYEGVTIAWNLAQNKLKCCGVTSSADWPRTPPPPSCYEDATCDSDFKTCKRGQSGGDIYPPLGSEWTNQSHDSSLVLANRPFLGQIERLQSFLMSFLLGKRLAAHESLESHLRFQTGES